MATVRGYSFKADTLTVDSANTTATGKIQWTVPSISSGATITSCRLTGIVKHVNNVNIYINDELLSNDVDGFTVYLDTSSVVTSVNIKAVASDNASGTISFSSLAHVLEYEVLEESEKQLVAEYKFNNTLYDLFPEFNDGFTYTHEDIVEENVTTRTIYTLKNKTINIENDSNIPAPAPEIIDDILQYSCSEWEVVAIDLSEYAGKNVDISFTITAKTEKWCKFEINNKVGSYETICDIWEPDSAIKIFDYNTTIENIPNNFKLILGGMNGIISNTNIIVEGENLFPSKLITEHYLYGNMNCYSTTPVLHDDNTLEFTNHWRSLHVNIQDYKNKNLNVSFDIKGIPNDISWSEFEYGFFNSNEQNYDMIEDHIFYTTLTEESSYHVEFDVMVTENTHFYLGGMGGHVENLKILVDNDLPTLIRFGTETESNSALSLLEVNYLDTSNVTDMSYMFYFCSKLEHLDVSNWDVSNVTDMSYMFYNCYTLSELDFSRWDVSNVINMELLFCNCCSFSQNTVNGLRSWDVSNVENMYAMIDCLCNNVTTIDLSGWDVSNVIKMNVMLEYNTELKYLNLNNWILNENVDTTGLLKKSDNLEKVSIMNSNAFTINKIIEQLPTRTTDSIGTLNIIGVDDITQVDTTTAQSKYWNIIAIHNAIKKIYLGNTPISTLFQQNKKIKNIYFGDNKLR